jgi:putative redox protein
MVKQEIEYRGVLRCGAVHETSKKELITDAPTDNHGRGESFSPTDLVATALATCQLTTMGIAAERDGVRLEGTKIAIEKHMSTDAPRRIVLLKVHFTFCAGIPAEKRRRYEQIAYACPVARSLHPSIKTEISFEYPDYLE